MEYCTFSILYCIRHHYDRRSDNTSGGQDTSDHNWQDPEGPSSWRHENDRFSEKGGSEQFHDDAPNVVLRSGGVSDYDIPEKPSRTSFSSNRDQENGYGSSDDEGDADNGDFGASSDDDESLVDGASRDDTVDPFDDEDDESSNGEEVEGFDDEGGEGDDDGHVSRGSSSAGNTF